MLRRLIGVENTVGPTLASLAESFGLSPLIGKPLAIIGDARLSARSDRSAVTERLLSTPIFADTQLADFAPNCLRSTVRFSPVLTVSEVRGMGAP